MATQTQTKEATKPIPCIQEPPVVGSLFAYRRDRLSLLMRMIQECGDVSCFHFGPFPLVLFNTPEYVHNIFVEHAYDFDKGEGSASAFFPQIVHGIYIRCVAVRGCTGYELP